VSSSLQLFRRSRSIRPATLLAIPLALSALLLLASPESQSPSSSQPHLGTKARPCLGTSCTATFELLPAPHRQAVLSEQLEPETQFSGHKVESVHVWGGARAPAAG
jgi:hypothetical protein